MNKFHATQEITEILKDFSIGEVEDILAMVNAVYPRRKNGSPGKKSYPSEKKPSGKKTYFHKGSEDPPTPPPKIAIDILKDIENEFEPLTAYLPNVRRQEGAMLPSMGRAQVQKRLKIKNRELRKVLESLSKASGREEAMIAAYESLNKIQAFRIAAIDASDTEGVRLINSPLPDDFSNLIPILIEVAEERKNNLEVLSTGFFSNKDWKYGGIETRDSQPGDLIEENNSQSDTDT